MGFALNQQLQGGKLRFFNIPRKKGSYEEICKCLSHEPGMKASGWGCSGPSHPRGSTSFLYSHPEKKHLSNAFGIVLRTRTRVFLYKAPPISSKTYLQLFLQTSFKTTKRVSVILTCHLVTLSHSFHKQHHLHPCHRQIPANANIIIIYTLFSLTWLVKIQNMWRIRHHWYSINLNNLFIIVLLVNDKYQLALA